MGCPVYRHLMYFKMSLSFTMIVGETGYREAGSKIWSLLLQDPSYHTAFLEASGDVKKFDTLVSYLPNSTFPLIEIKFESKSSKHESAIFSPDPTKSTLLGLSGEKRSRSLTPHHHQQQQQQQQQQHQLPKQKRDHWKTASKFKKKVIQLLMLMTIKFC